MATQLDPSLIKGITIGLGAIGPAVGVGIIGASVVSAVGRNPEIQGKILTMALIMVGLVDAYFAFVLLILFTTHG
jgi:F-type H+-transporting ATPase subunit c